MSKHKHVLSCVNYALVQCRFSQSLTHSPQPAVTVNMKKVVSTLAVCLVLAVCLALHYMGVGNRRQAEYAELKNATADMAKNVSHKEFNSLSS